MKINCLCKDIWLVIISVSIVCARVWLVLSSLCVACNIHPIRPYVCWKHGMMHTECCVASVFGMLPRVWWMSAIGMRLYEEHCRQLLFRLELWDIWLLSLFVSLFFLPVLKCWSNLLWWCLLPGSIAYLRTTHQ